MQIQWNIKRFGRGGKNYYLVRDTRSKVIKLYDGDKGRELHRDGFRVPCIVELRPPYNWESLHDHLFDLYNEYEDDDDEYNPDLY